MTNRIRKRFWAATTLLLASGLLLSGCTGSYGRLKPSAAWTDAFTNQLELPDYNYYYCGRENLPYAVVGIDPQYTFEDRLWHKIESKAIVYRRAAGSRLWNAQRFQGADILDAKGNKIGIWFSSYTTTTVKIGPGNTVAVYNPYRPRAR